MARNRHNGAFVFGTLVGGAAGALAALWKTPLSGAELRQKLGLPAEGGTFTPAEPDTLASPGNEAPKSSQSLADRALGLVEQVTAPLVGVKLGQTANNSQPGGPATVGEAARGATPVPGGGQITDSEFTDFPAQQPVGTSQG